MRSIVAVLLLGLVAAGPVPGPTVFAAAQSPRGSSVGEWASSLEMDPRVLDELRRFRAHDRALPEGYVRELAEGVRAEIVERADRAVERLETEGCAPSLDVAFDALPERVREPGASRSEVEEAFEESLVRVEVVACVETAVADPEEALRVYTDPAFRQSVESRIERIWSEEGLSCVATAGVTGLLDPARACNRIERYDDGAVAAEHSQVVRNPAGGAEGYEIVYFKESLKTFVGIPGGVALHYVNFTRAADLGRLFRWIGAGRIRDAEERRVSALERALGG